MYLNALPKTEAECPPGTNIYDDSCVLEGSGFAYGCPADQYELEGECACSTPGTVLANGKCVPYVSDETYRKELAQREASKGCPPKYPDYSDTFNSCIGYTDRGIIVGPKPTSPGINPLLILAAAAAFFFAG
jgi:hypothetical protein